MKKRVTGNLGISKTVDNRVGSSEEIVTSADVVAEDNPGDVACKGPVAPADVSGEVHTWDVACEYPWVHADVLGKVDTRVEASPY